MRYYLIIDRNPNTIEAIQGAFSDLVGYECVGVAENFTAEVNKGLKMAPEIVLINFDSIDGNPFRILKVLNKSFGISPNYIGLTSSFRKGFTAYKKGFVDVIDKPDSHEEIETSIKKYHATHFPSKLFCVHYYYDYRYMYLDDIVFLKADNYTTDFHLKDGTIINGFETLKHNHIQLPHNFQRIHRSYVINSYYVKRIDYGKKEIQLGYFEKVIQFSKTYMGSIETVKRILTEAKTRI